MIFFVSFVTLKGWYEWVMMNYCIKCILSPSYLFHSFSLFIVYVDVIHQIKYYIPDRMRRERLAEEEVARLKKKRDEERRRQDEVYAIIFEISFFFTNIVNALITSMVLQHYTI